MRVKRLSFDEETPASVNLSFPLFPSPPLCFHFTLSLFLPFSFSCFLSFSRYFALSPFLSFSIRLFLPVHWCALFWSKWTELKYEFLEHPQCSPDLAPLDFHLFPKLEMKYANKIICWFSAFKVDNPEYYYSFSFVDFKLTDWWSILAVLSTKYTWY